MKNDFKALYKRPEWKAKAEQIKAAAGHICQECGEDRNLQVHHPHYVKGKMPWDYEDLQCLCAPCHRKADWARKNSHSIATSRNVLVGKFFHSINEKGFVHWQGRVLGEPQPGLFLVQRFSWADGNPTSAVIVQFDDMLNWLFYDTCDQMTYSYDYGCASKLLSQTAKDFRYSIASS